MTKSRTETSDESLARDLLYAARYYLGSRQSIIVLAVIAIAAGFAFNWNWLVATGIAPILLSVLPCAVMCALGLCANRMFGGSCSTETPRSADAENRTREPAVLPPRPAASGSVPACCQEPAEAVAPTAVEKAESSERGRDQ